MTGPGSGMQVRYQLRQRPRWALRLSQRSVDVYRRHARANVQRTTGNDWARKSVAQAVWHHREQIERHNGLSMGLRTRNVLRFRQRRAPAAIKEKVAVVLSGGGNRGAAQV